MLTITISTRAAVLSAILLALAIASVPFAISRAEDGAPATVNTRAPVSTAFQYQGRLELDGIPANGTHQIGFTLYSDAVANAPVGNPITATVPVTDGVFSVPLDFGEDAFNGDARWLGVEVLVGNAFVPMGSRQALRATPYALFALNTPEHTHIGETWLGSNPTTFKITNLGYGATGLNITTTAPESTAIQANNSGNCGSSGLVCYGVWGKADTFPGGSGFGGVGVRGDGTNAGVLGIGPQFGVYGSSANVGVRGASSNGGTAVEGTSSGIGSVGVRGSVTGGETHGIGVLAEADGPDIGLQANSVNGDAVQALSDSGLGVYASGEDGGILAQANGAGSIGVEALGVLYGVKGVYWGVGAGTAGRFEGGNVYSQTGYTVGSDLRLKHDVRDLETALSTVMALRPVRYQYNVDDKEHIGLIAQEVQAILPELVTADPTTEDGMLTLNYSELIPVLIKAIQELEARVAELETGAP